MGDKVQIEAATPASLNLRKCEVFAGLSSLLVFLCVLAPLMRQEGDVSRLDSARRVEADMKDPQRRNLQVDGEGPPAPIWIQLKSVTQCETLIPEYLYFMCTDTQTVSHLSKEFSKFISCE